MNSGIDPARRLEQRATLLTDLQTIGSSLVIAPHPDDESLGCGGTIALLRAQGYDVHLLFVSDGTMSHPNSPSYPPARLRDLREHEAREAMQHLGVDARACSFLRIQDRQVPRQQTPGFLEAAAAMSAIIAQVKPATIFIPWQLDPHPDHRASWQLLQEALRHYTFKLRVLEYLIWLWELGTAADLPKPEEVQVWQIPIDTVMDQRNQAIAAHRSQVTRLIDDDPTGFFLSPELLRHFERPRELFLERNGRITEQNTGNPQL